VRAAQRRAKVPSMKMFFAGQWVDRPETIAVRNKYDGTTIDTVPKA
jgi:acyl-CoA reductase-like NAD-dependent aldehyde dehydrogenase